MYTFMNTFLGEMNTMNTLFCLTYALNIHKVIKVITNREKLFTKPFTNLFIFFNFQKRKSQKKLMKH